MNTYAIIPARSGSKGIPGKNIRLLGGYPLLAWSIVAGVSCIGINRVFLSTDSEEYVAIGKRFGAEAPFLRPSAISTDTSTDREYLLHAIHWLEDNEGKIPDLIALLRPTTPLRDVNCMAAAIDAFAHSDATSLCTGYELSESPVKNFRLNEDGTFSGFSGEQWLMQPRQLCPKAYAWDGVLDIFRTDYILKHEDLYGPRRMAWITAPNVDIDTMDDWSYAEFLVERGAGNILRNRLEELQNESD